jgi:hypothetical protein
MCADDDERAFGQPLFFAGLSAFVWAVDRVGSPRALWGTINALCRSPGTLASILRFFPAAPGTAVRLHAQRVSSCLPSR